MIKLKLGRRKEKKKKQPSIDLNSSEVSSSDGAEVKFLQYFLKVQEKFSKLQKVRSMTWASRPKASPPSLRNLGLMPGNHL